jgi:hypothetical protein
VASRKSRSRPWARVEAPERKSKMKTGSSPGAQFTSRRNETSLATRVLKNGDRRCLEQENASIKRNQRLSCCHALRAASPRMEQRPWPGKTARGQISKLDSGTERKLLKLRNVVLAGTCSRGRKNPTLGRPRPGCR